MIVIAPCSDWPRGPRVNRGRSALKHGSFTVIIVQAQCPESLPSIPFPVSARLEEQFVSANSSAKDFQKHLVLFFHTECKRISAVSGKQRMLMELQAPIIRKSAQPHDRPWVMIFFWLLDAFGCGSR